MLFSVQRCVTAVWRRRNAVSLSASDNACPWPRLPARGAAWSPTFGALTCAGHATASPARVHFAVHLTLAGAVPTPRARGVLLVRQRGVSRRRFQKNKVRRQHSRLPRTKLRLLNSAAHALARSLAASSARADGGRGYQHSTAGISSQSCNALAARHNRAPPVGTPLLALAQRGATRRFRSGTTWGARRLAEREPDTPLSNPTEMFGTMPAIQLLLLLALTWGGNSQPADGSAYDVRCPFLGMAPARPEKVARDA